MGASQSAVAKAIASTLGNDGDLYAFPGDPLYKLRDARPYNLDIQVRPVAVAYPRTREQVAAVVRCAVENGCLGGVDGAVVIDLKHFQQFSMDRKTWRATIGGGTLLGDVTKRLHDSGNRAMAHGTCPQVGIGGHATIGGLGPASRQWGSSLDHVVEVEIVLADSSIKRCSETQNAEIFWAVKGAGGSFGVITEFVVRTEPEPGEAVVFSFSFHFGKYAFMAPIFAAWQTFVADPKLTRKFTSAIVFTELGMVISGTFFGTEKEYDKLHMDSRFPGNQDKRTIVFKDWLGLVGHWAEDFALQIGGGLPAPLYTKSLAFNGCNLIPDEAIDKILTYMDNARKGTLVWFVIFDLEGGAINDVPQDATAYAHRDALFYMQSYAVGLPKVSSTTKNFLRGLNQVVKEGMPGGMDFGAYAGYVDPELVNGQEAYWRGNLKRLERIKGRIDPGDVFWNPQSVRPVVGGGEGERQGGAVNGLDGNGNRNANANGNGSGVGKPVEALQMREERTKKSFGEKLRSCFR
ncbi:hypothetical protein ACEPPN_011798 [Leptodophora sp. 'Broadleaf-Isolate-01']